MPSLLRWILVPALAGLLSACAGPRVIDSAVQSFATATPAVRPATYRFERLPSQDAAAQERVEALARTALAKVDLTPAPLVAGAVAGTAAAAPTARYAVQVGVQVTAIVSPYDFDAPGGPWGPWGPHRHFRQWGAFGPELLPTWWRHAVHFVLRDSASGQPAYESRAWFDGPWSDSANLLPVVMDAALQGYPQAVPGVRKVVIELPAAAEPAE